MHALFSREGEQALHRLKNSRCLYAFNFDGTLSPIVSEPDKALIPPATAEQLIELDRRFPLAIISGRSREDLKKRLPQMSAFLVGNHGIENPPFTKAIEKECRQVTLTWKSQLNRLDLSRVKL